MYLDLIFDIFVENNLLTEVWIYLASKLFLATEVAGAKHFWKSTSAGPLPLTEGLQFCFGEKHFVCSALL
jgi:hypothetical protein